MKSRFIDKIDKQFGWLVLASMVIVFGTALWFAQGQSVWYDEGYSILLAHHSIVDLIKLTSVDAHPPLYYLLLKLIGTLSNWNELAMRSMSALFGALAIGMMALTVRKLFSQKVALVTLPFLVLAPFLIRYDYEIRMYALVTLIGTAATYVIVLARHSSKTRLWVIYGLLVALGMYTLYLSCVIWLAHLVWLWYTSRGKGTRILQQPWIRAYIGAALVFVPWMPVVVYQTIHSALPGIMYPITVQQLLGILGFLTTYTPDWQIGAWMSAVLILWMILFGYLYAKVWHDARLAYRQGILLLLFCFVVALVFYLIISLPPLSPKFIPRYVAHICIFAYALIGVLVALGWRTGRRKLVGTFTLLTLALVAYGMVHLYGVGNFIIERNQKPETKVVLAAIGGCNNTTMIASGAFGYIDQWYDLRGCDTRFYQSFDPPYAGGYAPLHGSPLRLTSTTSLTTARIVFVYYGDSNQFITVDARYKLVDQKVFDMTYVDIYQKK